MKSSADPNFRVHIILEKKQDLGGRLILVAGAIDNINNNDNKINNKGIEIIKKGLKKLDNL